jgi:hypothetical protein
MSSHLYGSSITSLNNRWRKISSATISANIPNGEISKQSHKQKTVGANLPSWKDLHQQSSFFRPILQDHCTVNLLVCLELHQISCYQPPGSRINFAVIVSCVVGHPSWPLLAMVFALEVDTWNRVLIAVIGDHSDGAVFDLDAGQ